MKHIKKFKLIIIAIILYIGLLIFRSDLFFNAINITKGFLLEMIQVLPPVLVITALITVWVPSSVIRKGLGEQSGIKGRLLSFFIGAISAGPIYAAFPAVLVLFKKGASISNMVIILSSWAVIKIPMLFVETSFLGIKFTAIRFVLTVPAIYIMSLLVEKLIKRDEITEENNQDIVSSLPNLNCGACGYLSCIDFALAVEANDKNIMDCIILKKNEENDYESK
ncbi:MAG: permease [Spirochaetaceae bacterium]